MRRLRRRLDNIENEVTRTTQAARHTLSEADKLMLAVQQELLVTLRDLLLDIQDGVRIGLHKEGEGTLLQFLRGEIDDLPLQVKIQIEEQENNA